MTSLETLLSALKFYEIEILSVDGNQVKTEKNFELAVEANGIYKLIDDGIANTRRH
jgi:hypothetical protein